jgi:hypothetical protein
MPELHRIPVYRELEVYLCPESDLQRISVYGEVWKPVQLRHVLPRLMFSGFVFSVIFIPSTVIRLFVVSISTQNEADSNQIGSH